MFFSYLLEVSGLGKNIIAKINIGTFILSSLLCFILPYNVFYGDGIYYTYGLDTKYTYLISTLYIFSIFIVVFLKRKVIVKKKAIQTFILQIP